MNKTDSRRAARIAAVIHAVAVTIEQAAAATPAVAEAA